MTMPLILEPYLTQKQRLPSNGRRILAQFDNQTIVVYQAFRPAIGHFAAQHGCFGGDFSLRRMSWIKTSFLWMMYRSGWGTKPDQEVVLAIWLQRSAFDAILAQVTPAWPDGAGNAAESETFPLDRRTPGSRVRLQWDPDRTPGGGRLERKAIQLGLRGDALARYAKEWVVHIEDISPFVREQYQHVKRRGQDRSPRYQDLLVPREEVYPVTDIETARLLGTTTADR